MLSGIISLLGAVLIACALFRRTEGGFRLTLSLGAAPMIISMVLYLLFLFFPGIQPGSARLIMATGFTVAGGYLLFLNHDFNLSGMDYSLLAPLAISLPAFFFVTRYVSSFDPINYAFIGKTFLAEMSVRGYPFISPDHTGGVFSWFSHPPMFSLMQTWLELTGFDTWVRYIGPFYYTLVNILVFQVVRKRTDLTVAISVVFVLAVTPFFVRTSVEGFTAPIRIFFFAGTAVLLSLSEEKIGTTAIFAGMAMLTHTIGLLAVPGSLLALILLDRCWNWKKLFRFGVIACLTGSLPYLVNLWKFHSLATTTVFVSAFGHKLVNDVFQYQFIQKGMPTAAARLMYGYFSPIFRFSSYGLAFILGFAGLMALVGDRWKSRDRLVTVALGFLIVYFTLHFLPIHHNIFILSPRYPLTILPILLMAGAISLPKWRFRGRVTATVALIAVGSTLLFASPFYRQPCLQCEMVQYINAHLTPKDHVLVSRSPFFFLDIQNIPGTDAMEPSLSPLYRESDLNRVLHQLKEMKITYVLLPYAPTPFESEGVVRRLMETPGILEGVKHTAAFHLFRIHYPATPLKKPEPLTLLSWRPNMPGLKLTAYDHSPEKHPLRFWYAPDGLHIFSPFADTRLALARDIPWRKNAQYIETKKCDSMEISIRFKNAVFPFKLYWDIFQFDQAGTMLQVSHPRPIEVTPGWKSLVMPTAYPRMLSSRLPLDSRTVKIALSFSFYSESGGTCVNAIDITGYR